MQRLYTTALLITLLTGCASHVAQRDATGSPSLQRLSSAELAERAKQVPSILGVPDIVALSREGHAADEIVARMRATGSRLQMSRDQQSILRQHGVPDATIAALVDAEAEAQRTDRITAEADRAATRKQHDEARREIYRSYSYDPYWGWPHSSLGYGWHRGHSGWHSGIGWGWGWGW